MMGIVIAIIGFVCIANGAMMLPDLEAVSEQTVSAIYIVGGLVIVALGLMLIVISEATDKLIKLQSGASTTRQP